jgi:hypothetical protein
METESSEQSDRGHHRPCLGACVAMEAPGATALFGYPKRMYSRWPHVLEVDLLVVSLAI